MGLLTANPVVIWVNSVLIWVRKYFSFAYTAVLVTWMLLVC